MKEIKIEEIKTKTFCEAGMKVRVRGGGCFEGQGGGEGEGRGEGEGDQNG